MKHYSSYGEKRMLIINYALLLSKILLCLLFCYSFQRNFPLTSESIELACCPKGFFDHFIVQEAPISLFKYLYQNEIYDIVTKGTTALQNVPNCHCYQ